MEDPTKSPSAPKASVATRTSGDPDFVGAAAALKRASAKAIERARRAGLEPVIFQPSAGFTEPVLREDPAPYGKTPHGETPRTAS